MHDEQKTVTQADDAASSGTLMGPELTYDPPDKTAPPAALLLLLLLVLLLLLRLPYDRPLVRPAGPAQQYVCGQVYVVGLIGDCSVEWF